MFQIHKSILSASVTVAAIYVGGVMFAPDATASVLSSLAERFENLTAPDCEKQPVTCMRAKQIDLQAAYDQTGEILRQFKTEKERAQAVAQRNRKLLSTNQLYLQEGKRTMNAQLTGPYVFVGQTYPSQAEFEAQLELLFMEGVRLTSVTQESENFVKTLARTERELLSRKSEMRAQLELLPSRIAMLEAQQAYEGLTRDLAAIETTLKSSQRDYRDAADLLRTTRDLTEDDQAGRVSTNNDFQAFLYGTAPTTQPTQAN